MGQPVIADLARRARICEAHERIGEDLFALCEDEDLSPQKLIALLAYLTGAVVSQLSEDEISQPQVMDLIWQNVVAGAAQETLPLALDAGRPN